MSTSPEPPPHVLTTFGFRDATPEPLRERWHCGDAVLTYVKHDHARATFSASLREHLDVEGVRVARPVRSSDGRWVASGWSADTFLSGAPEPRHDEVLAASQRLHAALAGVARPALLSPTATAARTDVLGVADRVAWGEQLEPFTVDPGPASALDPPSVETFRDLARARRKVHGPPQLVHGDLYGTVLFAGAAEPAVTDVVPYWHPAPYGAAVAAVDALAWDDADAGLLDRFAEQEDWEQLVLRAVLFRLAVHTLHARAPVEAYEGLARVAQLVRQRL